MLVRSPPDILNYKLRPRVLPSFCLDRHPVKMANVIAVKIFLISVFAFVNSVNILVKFLIFEIKKNVLNTFGIF